MIVVTGASRGIGRAVADRLHTLGFDVLGISRTSFEGSFESIQADVSDFEAIKNIASSLRDRNIPVSGLVNAAGIASMNLAIMTPATTVAKIINTNLVGTINVNQAFANSLIRNKSGSIVNFSTIAVRLALAGESIYAASKAGVEVFTRAFARELAPHGVRANCIAPGPIDTNLLRGVAESQIDKIVRQQVIQHQFQLSDVCDVVEFLLGDKSKSISGQVLSIGG